jgi:O-methyltransferase
MSRRGSIPVLWFGTGSMTSMLLPAIKRDILHILAFIDERPQMRGTCFHSTPVIDTAETKNFSFAYVLLGCRQTAAVSARLREQGITSEKIVCLDLEKILHERGGDPGKRSETLLNYLRQFPGLAEAIDLVSLSKTPWLSSQFAPTKEQYGEFPLPLSNYESKFISSILASPVHDFGRLAALNLIANEIKERKIRGSTAELGVYKGKFAKWIRKLFPDRLLYLFDTFTGFDLEQFNYDKKNYPQISEAYFDDVDMNEILADFSNSKFNIIKKGFFPDTTAGIEDIFCFVSLDVDLYQPTLDGLHWFYQRLEHGGYIMIHDYGNKWYNGVKQATKEFCARENINYVPICDLAYSCIITK